LAPVKATIEQWVAHKDARPRAALVYYSVFWVGTLIVIAIGIAGLAFGQEAARSAEPVFGNGGQPAAAIGVSARSGAPRIRDRFIRRVFKDPGLAAHHFMLRCARETSSVSPLNPIEYLRP
jgi:hypothetical protein